MIDIVMTPARYKDLPPDQIRALEQSRPFQKMLGRLSNKWNVVVIRRLSSQPKRPSELRREIGNISAKVLTQTLRELESYGLVQREIHPVVPPRVDYSLTELGRTLIPALDLLRDWAMDHNGEVEAAIEKYERENFQ